MSQAYITDRSDNIRSRSETASVAPNALRRHYERTALIDASPEEVFDFVDDHARLSAHMAKSSWMMLGSSMVVDVDEGGGRLVGSHIRMHGTMAGLRLALDEVVTSRERPFRKEWETIGTPRLLVLAWYTMGVHIEPDGNGARVRLFIDYRRPTGPVQNLLSRMFGGVYARWCVGQMLNGVAAHFATP